jgi:hypothetical protein
MNQNTITASLNNALLPSPHLVDGRTERDWLGFIADFASLINFYDASNQLNGNWSPFLLKDPIILLASISKTNVSKQHSLYLKTCMQLELETAGVKTAHQFNSLFNQLLRLFLKIERWLYFMQKSDQEYGLKKYMCYQVENVFSPILWALLALRQQFFINKIIIEADAFEGSVFENADYKTWRLNKNKNPYWEILGLNKSFIANTTADFLNALKRVGDKLFVFFKTITHHAKESFEKLKSKIGKFPDTILMRTFVNLLMNHSNQLNGIAQKHLDFYYTDILKQKINNALPDSVFVAIELGKKNFSFLLPKQTAFDAGVDAEKKPISFSTTQNVSLNPATIVSAKTMSLLQVANALLNLYVQNIATPATIKKDEAGKVQGWPIFGGTKPPISAPITLGFAIASPLLLLKEGIRNLQITLTFEQDGALNFLNTASYYLSTQTSWFLVEFSIQPLANNSQSILLSLVLDGLQPPIEPFVENPDGYACDWPLLKIEFNGVQTSSTVPVLSSLEIAVAVNNLSTLQLYNDFGALDAKKPFQLFGPTPLVNSNFIMGSNEIFSKPLQSLFLDMTWDGLPTNFQTYYQEYNNYVAFVTQKTNASEQLVKIEHKPKGIVQKIESIVAGGVQIVKGFAKKIKDSVVELFQEIIQILKDILGIIDPNPSTPFNNICFTVDFEWLNNNSWKKIDLNKQGISVATDGTITPIPYTVNQYCIPNASQTDNLLFSTTDELEQNKSTDKSFSKNDKLGQCKLTDKSFFSYTAIPPKNKVTPTNFEGLQTTTIDFVKRDPEPQTTNNETITVDANIQNTPLVYRKDSTAGFIKMTLKTPTPYGFGSELYPEVVANIALQNALQISKDPKIDPKKLLSPAKLPFAPKLKAIQANYSATQLYDLKKTDTYPLQCFSYSPFATYLSYDNTASVPVYNYNVGDNGIAQTPPSTAVPLFTSLHNYKGFLYIELTDVVAPNEINFYVELGRKEGNIPSDTKPDYYYLGTMGWQSLPILSDGTNNWSCSGIVTFNFPKNISKKTGLMPGQNYWICVATKSDISNYPDITFLKTNGVLLTRSGNEYLLDTSEPKIESSVILKPLASIPEISNTTQPFPSFGGKAMENGDLKNKRISNRLKTKDRVLSIGDYYRMIQQEFHEIYYSKTICNHKKTQVYVVKKYETVNDFSAFSPMVTVCTEKKIQQYLTAKASAFDTIEVSNFVFLYVTVNATIILMEGYDFQGVLKTIEAALNLFLSPWISTNTPQITIDESLKNTQVIHFIKTISGVADVQKLTFSTTTTNKDFIDQKDLNIITLEPNTNLLIVSSMKHSIDEHA